MESRVAALSQTQRAVVERVCHGDSNKELAAHLRVSERAVESRLTRIYEKLGVGSRSGLIGLALSEIGFGLAAGARSGTPSEVDAFPAIGSLEDAGVYDHAPFMVAVTHGPEHRFTYVNRVAAEVAGRDGPSLVGRAVHEIYPELGAAFANLLDEAYRTGRATTSGGAVPARWTHADGSFRETRVNVIFQPLRDLQGAVVGLLHIGAEAAV